MASDVECDSTVLGLSDSWDEMDGALEVRVIKQAQVLLELEHPAGPDIDSPGLDLPALDECVQRGVE